jgi:uncharacterized protein YifE (UPF0438 family)
MVRTLSYSEIQMAMTCQARHAFAYTGRLTDGKTLKRRQMTAALSNGRAWGAAVAAWHAYEHPDDLFIVYAAAEAQMAAYAAMRAAYATDIAEQAELGIPVDPEISVSREEWMGRILAHHMATSERLPNLTRLEGELNVPIPSRSGRRSSSRYRFHGFIDGFTNSDGLWIVEYKLRDQLTPLEVIQLSRQIRWYSWALAQELHEEPVGVIVDERLAEAPKPPRMVNGRKKTDPQKVPSHAKDQLCTPEAYIAICQEFHMDPVEETVEHLKQRKWSERHYIRFDPGELEEAGAELVSAAKTIRDLDSGERYPVRNAQPQLCRSCRWREACANPHERVYLQTIFDYTVPKRLRTGRLPIYHPSYVNVETGKEVR